MYHFDGDIQRSTIHCSEYQEKKPEEEAYEWCLKRIDPSCFEKLWINRNIAKLVKKIRQNCEQVLGKAIGQIHVRGIFV